MSEHKQDKWLYTFTIYKEIETPQEEEIELNGEKVKVTKQVKEKVPIVCALKRPNRRMYERADMFFGVQLSEGIRAGLLTKALLLKRYRNDGGALSDADSQYFYELTSQLSGLEDEHQRLLINVENTTNSEKIAKIGEVVKKKMEVLQALQSLETVNQALFAHTAESKAQAKLNSWWLVYLAVWDEKGDSNFVDFFAGDTFEEKMSQWDKFDEERHDYIVSALARFSLLIGLWNGGAQTKEEFQQGEKDYGFIADEAVASSSKTETEPAPEINIVAGATGTSEISPASTV